METETEAQRTVREQRALWGRLAATVSEIARYKRVTGTSLALQMGMPRATVSMKLNGRTPIMPWEADGFAIALGVPRELLDKSPTEALLDLLAEEEARRGNGCSSRRARAAA